jgi:tetratricopeptide (TPR) repeat protein
VSKLIPKTRRSIPSFLGLALATGGLLFTSFLAAFFGWDMPGKTHLPRLKGKISGKLQASATFANKQAPGHAGEHEFSRVGRKEKFSELFRQPQALGDSQSLWVVAKANAAFRGEVERRSDSSTKGPSSGGVVPGLHLASGAGEEHAVFEPGFLGISLFLPGRKEDLRLVEEGLSAAKDFCGMIARIAGEWPDWAGGLRGSDWSEGWVSDLIGKPAGQPGLRKAPWMCSLALLALEAKPEELSEFHRTFRRLSGPILEGLPTDRPPGQEDLSELLSRLHLRVFVGGYDPGATDPRHAIQSGRYNCVSGTLLFLDLCRELGWHCQAVEWPNHLACRVTGPNLQWEVELTLPPSLWQQQPVVREVDPMASGTKLETVPIETNPRPRILADRQVVAVVYYNRALELLAEGRYREALEAQVASVWWDPENPYAWANLVAILNNWAVQKVREGKPEEALGLLELAAQLLPGFHPVETNLRFLRQTSWMKLRQPNPKYSLPEAPKNRQE